MSTAILIPSLSCDLKLPFNEILPMEKTLNVLYQQGIDMIVREALKNFLEREATDFDVEKVKTTSEKDAYHLEFRCGDHVSVRYDGILLGSIEVELLPYREAAHRYRLIFMPEKLQRL